MNLSKHTFFIILFCLCQYSYSQNFPSSSFNYLNTYPNNANTHTYDNYVTYRIFQQGGQFFEFRGRIKFDKIRNEYYLSNNSGKIYYNDVDSIFACINRRDTLKLYVVENLWLFKLMSGKISLWTDKPTSDFYFTSHIMDENGKLYKADRKFMKYVFPVLIKRSNKAVDLYLKDRKIRFKKNYGGVICLIGGLGLCIVAPAPVFLVSGLIITFGGPVYCYNLKRIPINKIVEAANTD